MAPLILQLTALSWRQRHHVRGFDVGLAAVVPECAATKIAQLAAAYRQPKGHLPQRVPKRPNALRNATENQSPVKT
jgi:hypothetical protein